MDDDKKLLQNYYRLAKSVWNTSHEIDVCGHEVEIYVQDANEPHHSTGVYSIRDDEWIEKPKCERGQLGDLKAVKRKFTELSERIIDIEQKAKNETKSALVAAQKLKEKIRKLRKSGLELNGELSVENLAFKQLRNQGYLRRLSDAAKLAYDNQFIITNCPSK